MALDAALTLPQPTDLRPVGTAIDTLSGLLDLSQGYGAQLRRIEPLAHALRKEFASTGKPDRVETHDLVSLPFPTKFGLWRAPLSPVPFLTITNRLLIVRWTESDGIKRILVWEPSDVELDANTPFFLKLIAKTPERFRGLAVKEHGTVASALQKAGVDPSDVDYIAFDHLHTQDVRRWLGTTKPQADGLSGEAFFPKAQLIVQSSELIAMADLHPLQRPWYQASTFIDLPPQRLRVIDGDVLLGPGVALLSTPGHVFGNQTLMLNTGTGIWTTSENAIAAECLAPEHSKIPGVAKWADQWEQEVILNANTLETTAAQYNSMVLEKTLADHSQRDSRFVQFFPSSELTAHWMNPGTSPTFTHDAISHG